MENCADVYVSVKHEAYTELKLVDAIVYKLKIFDSFSKRIYAIK